jgi:plastocyanin
MSRLVFIACAMMSGLASAPSRAETIQVVIDKLGFAPAEVEAKVGDTIEWLNKDSFAHTATVKGGVDVMIPAGKSGRAVLEKPESVEYYCRFHPNMKGRITVSPR